MILERQQPKVSVESCKDEADIEAPPEENDDFGREENIVLILESLFIRSAPKFARPTKDQFVARLKRSLSKLAPNVSLPPTLLEYLYDSGLDLLRGLQDWDETMQALNGPEIAATQRYFENRLRKLSVQCQAMLKDRKLGVPEAVSSWDFSALHDHFLSLKDANAYLAELVKLRGLGRSEVASQLLCMEADSLKRKLEGTPLARKRIVLLTAFAFALRLIQPGKDNQRALRMRLKRTAKSPIWQGKSEASVFLLSMLLRARVLGTNEGTALKPR